MAANMSPLVMRPSGPVPGTDSGAMPDSALRRRTEGASGISAAGTFGACGAGAGTAFDGEAAFAGSADLLTLARAPSPWLICPSSAPTATVSPSLARISDRMPAAGAGTSIVTFSVSSSTRGSSTATRSPACLNHFPMVASVTDSPSVGTRISVMGLIPGQAIFDPRTTGVPRSQGRVRDKRASPVFERIVEKRPQLGEVFGHEPGRGRSRSCPADIARPVGGAVHLIKRPCDVGLNKIPGSHIARLFLAPHDLGLSEAAEFLHQRLGRERVELLDAQE